MSSSGGRAADGDTDRAVAERGGDGGGGGDAGRAVQQAAEGLPEEPGVPCGCRQCAPPPERES